MNKVERFRNHVTQARRMADYTTDNKIRVILKLLSDELEEKITAIEGDKLSMPMKPRREA